jgi:S1-C subfamily serine protease
MHVESAAPADQAGVLLGDVLVEMDGRAFSEVEDLSEVLGKKGIGQEVQTSLIRGGQRLQLAIRVAARPSR